jgi:hypothetical protein
MPLYLDDVQAQTCTHPECTDPRCDELFLSGRCHPGRPVVAVAVKSRGTVVLRCAKCQAVVTEIAIASRPVN